MVNTEPTVLYSHANRWAMHPFIPESAKRILDIGCNTGGFGESLKAIRDVEVWGVEPNKIAAAQASGILDNVVVDRFTEETQVPDDFFDIVVFNDVLEHMVEPWESLRLAKRKLRTGGCVVASIPNILHQSNLLHMLFERDFRYEADGIRDRTHLRFFTRLSAIRLFEECDYKVLRVEGINEDWWTPSLVRRFLYMVFGKTLNETKFIQFALVGQPK